MVVINNFTPLCNYGLYLSTILTSTDYYGEVIYLPNVIVQYIHTYITPYIQLKVVKKLKDHRLPLSLAKDWTDFVLSDKSQSSYSPTLSACWTRPFVSRHSTLSALASRLECTSLQFAARANLDSPRPKPQDYFSVRRLDDRTDGVSQYRGKTMSFQRNTLSAALYIPLA